MKRFGTFGLCSLIVVALLFVPRYAVTKAQSSPDLTVFGAPLLDVMANGGTVISQHLEDNATAAADPLFLRPTGTTAASLQQQGRQTGFSASFTVGTVAYAYSASLFGSDSQAQAAFKAQHDFWYAGSSDPANSETVETTVGDPGFADWWTAATISNGTVYSINEEFFTRGKFLVEVYLILSADDLQTLGLNAIDLQHALALSLDGIAMTANVVPTVMPTATSVPSPTPKPIATAKPAVPKSVKCKKGYKLVKGKCKKQHKLVARTNLQSVTIQRATAESMMAIRSAPSARSVSFQREVARLAPRSDQGSTLGASIPAFTKVLLTQTTRSV